MLVTFSKRVRSVAMVLAVTFGCVLSFDVVQATGGDLIWEVSSNPSFSPDYAFDIAMDPSGNNIYVAGTDSQFGSSDRQWRVEKRSTTDGSLIWSINTNPTDKIDTIRSITVDDTGIYVGGDQGYDGTLSAVTKWRMEKRSLVDGSLIWEYTVNPSTDYSPESVLAVSVDASGVYFSGGECCTGGGGNKFWRIEKRDLTTGASLWTRRIDVDEQSMVMNGGRGTALDTTGIYVVGTDKIDTVDYRWLMKKLNLTNGTDIWSVAVNPTAGSFRYDAAYSATVYSDGVYVGGYDNLGTRSGWHLEKRSHTDGSLIWSQSADPSGGYDYLYEVASNSYGVYTVGTDDTPYNNRWLIRARSHTDGSLLWSVTDNLTFGDDKPRGIVADSDSIYIAGYDVSGWVIQKRSAVGVECSDGIDNDGDGDIDYPADVGCESALEDDETLPPAPDLISENINIQGELTVGTPITFTGDIKNDGNLNIQNLDGWGSVLKVDDASVAAVGQDAVNNILYAGTSNDDGYIYRCDLSIGCNTSSDWQMVFDPPSRIIWFIAFDHINNDAMYAGTLAGIYKCNTATLCDEDKDWILSVGSGSVDVGPRNYLFTDDYFFTSEANDAWNNMSTPISYCPWTSRCDEASDWSHYELPKHPFAGPFVWSHFTLDSVNDVIYLAGNDLYDDISDVTLRVVKCNLSTNCDSASDWVDVYRNLDDTINYPTDSLLDPINNVLYIAGGWTVLRCDLSTGCNNQSDFQQISLAISHIAFDSVKNIMYGGAPGGGSVYSCEVTTLCDDVVDWIQEIDLPGYEVRAMHSDNVNEFIYASNYTGSSGSGKLFRNNFESKVRFCIDNPNCLTDPSGIIGADVEHMVFNSGASAQVSETWIASEGSHTLYLCADVSNTVSESDETNNCISETFDVAGLVTLKPDLISENLNIPGTLIAGSVLSFSADILNQGAGDMSHENSLPSVTPDLNKKVSIFPAGPGLARDMVISGDYLYSVGIGPGSSANEFEIFDISGGISIPIKVSGVNIGDSSSSFYEIDFKSDGAGTFVYIGGATGGTHDMFRIYDVSNPAAPVLTGSTNGWMASSPLQMPFDIIVVGNYGYLGRYTSDSLVTPTMKDALEIFDVSDKNLPVKVSGVESTDKSYYALSDIEIINNYAYLGFKSNSGGAGEFHIVDVTDPSSPVTKGGLTASYVDGIAYRDNYVYAAIGGFVFSKKGIEIYDVSDKDNPTLAESVPTGDSAYNIKVLGGHLYVSYASGKMVVYDIETDPANPIEVKTVSISSPRDISFSSDKKYIYVRSGGSNLAITDTDFRSSFCIDSIDALGCAAGTSGVVIATGTKKALDATAVVSENASWIATPGTHTLYFCTDIDSSVSESNETNNCISETFTVTDVSNLTSQSLIETSGNPIQESQVLTFSAEVLNNGPLPTDENFVDVFEHAIDDGSGSLSFAQIGISDVHILLAANTAESDNISFTVPSGTSGNELIIQHCVDYDTINADNLNDGLVTESDESVADNCSQINLGTIVVPPSGSISATPCTIPLSGTSCPSTVTWSSSDFIGTPSILQGATQFSIVSPSSAIRSINPDDRIFYLKDTGSTFVKSAAAGVGCASGGVWADSSCLLQPVITVVPDAYLVRSGETTEVDVSITSDYDLTCTLYGALDAVTTNPFSHTAPGVAGETTVYTFTSNVMTSARIARVECVATDVSFAPLGAGAEDRIEVVPTFQEV